MTADSG